MESQLTGNWFSLPREPTQCESPMVSAVQIGHSDTSSSAVTSCSYPHPPETLGWYTYMHASFLGGHLFDYKKDNNSVYDKNFTNFL
jgi:hypothetical protein